MLCTGQKPNTHLLNSLDKRLINPENLQAHILRTMQVSPLKTPDSSVSKDPSANTSTRIHTDAQLPSLQLASHDSALTHPLSPDTSSGASPSSTQSSILDESASPVSTNPSTTSDDANPGTPSYSHIFAIGDAADAFGDIQAGHTAHRQSSVAVENILRMIKYEQEVGQGANDKPLELKEYWPGKPGIKLSLGRVSNCL